MSSIKGVTGGHVLAALAGIVCLSIGLINLMLGQPKPQNLDVWNILCATSILGGLTLIIGAVYLARREIASSQLPSDPSY